MSNTADCQLICLQAVRNRYQTIMKEQNLKRQQQQQAATADEDDDYEPEFEPMDAVGDATEAGAISAQMADAEPDLVSLGPFVLPQPPPLSEEEAGEIGRSAVARVFSMVNAAETAPSPAKSKSQQHLGFARLAGSTFDRDAWVVLLTRLATRAPAGLEVADKSAVANRRQPTISDSIRETLYRYILEDFRGRLNIGITWLNEEWYNDRIQMKAAAAQREGFDEPEPTVSLHYDTWVLRLLDGFLPYIDGRDIKVLVRFLSEIPEITIPITQRVASLAKDPERVNLCVQALMSAYIPPLTQPNYANNAQCRYLIMFRPPAREMCLDRLENVYQTCKSSQTPSCPRRLSLIQNIDEESRPAAGKVLAKWRPQQVQPAETTTNGAPESAPPPPPQEAQASTVSQ